MAELGLYALEKADNITPSLMIDCLNRLLSRAEELSPVLVGSHLWVTTYYSVQVIRQGIKLFYRNCIKSCVLQLSCNMQSDGEICIPWNWK